MSDGLSLEDLATLLEGVKFGAKVDVPVEQIAELAYGVYLEQVNDFRTSTRDAIGTVVRFAVLEAVQAIIDQILAAVGMHAVIADAYLNGGAE